MSSQFSQFKSRSEELSFIKKRKAELEELIKNSKLELSKLDDEISTIRSKITKTENLKSQYDTDDELSNNDFKYISDMNKVSLQNKINENIKKNQMNVLFVWNQFHMKQKFLWNVDI